MKNKIRLKEDELRQIIRESVHSQLINEANPLKNWWNKFTNRFNNRNNYDEYDDDEYDDYDEDTGNDNEDDDIDWDGGDSNYEEPDEVKIPQYENPEKFNAGGGGQPFYYGGEPGEPSRVDLQGNWQPHGKETSWNNGGWLMHNQLVWLLVMELMVKEMVMLMGVNNNLNNNKVLLKRKTVKDTTLTNNIKLHNNSNKDQLRIRFK